MCIVRDDAESRVGRVALHNTAECHLGGGCHGVSFVEDYEFVGCERDVVSGLRRGGEDLFCACGDQLSEMPFLP
jgi:hypothetical protein